MADGLISHRRAAEILGCKPESVRHILARYEVTEERGYPQDRVEWVANNRKRRGQRTDLDQEEQ